MSCDISEPHLEIFICQGHSFFKINNPVKIKDSRYNEEEAYKGFYPGGAGRVALEVQEGLYKKDELQYCQSSCESLSQEKIVELEKNVNDVSKFLREFDPQSSKIFNRSEAYNMLSLNCVDFSQSLSLRYLNKTIVQLFLSQNKTLQIYSAPEEPCFGARPAQCLFWGIDKAAFYAYYRDGGLMSALWQLAKEKPFAYGAPILANTALIMLTGPWAGFILQAPLLAFSTYILVKNWGGEKYPPYLSALSLGWFLSTPFIFPTLIAFKNGGILGKSLGGLWIVALAGIIHKTLDTPADDILEYQNTATFK